MSASLDFTILLMHQIEKSTINDIYDYFNGSINIEYINNIITNADADEKYFDKILLNYLVC